jgi:hypothetical protein
LSPAYLKKRVLLSALKVTPLMRRALELRWARALT